MFLPKAWQKLGEVLGTVLKTGFSELLPHKSIFHDDRISLHIGVFLGWQLATSYVVVFSAS